MNANPDWWKSFFNESFGSLQEDGICEDRAQREVDALERLLGLSPGARVLDAPCGAGRHSLELARRGYNVTGIDFNSKLIELGASRALDRNLKVRFEILDLRELVFEASFDAAFCHWASFGYFDDATNADFLRRMGRSLVAGGKFFIDTPHVAETFFAHFRARDWSSWGEGEARTRILEEHRFDMGSSRLESTWTFLKEGKDTTYDISIRVHTYRELLALLREAGFTHFEAWDPGEKPYALDSRRLWLVATKG